MAQPQKRGNEEEGGGSERGFSQWPGWRENWKNFNNLEINSRWMERSMSMERIITGKTLEDQNNSWKK